MKNTYTIVFGFETLPDETFVGTLEEAEAYADKKLECSKKDVYITEGGKVVSRRPFIAGEYNKYAPPQEKPIRYNNIGYYGDWIRS